MIEMGFRRFWGRNGYPVYVPSPRMCAILPGKSGGIWVPAYPLGASGRMQLNVGFDYNIGGFALANQDFDIVMPATGHVNITYRQSTGGVGWGGPPEWFFDLILSGAVIGEDSSTGAYGPGEITLTNVPVVRGDVLGQDVGFVFVYYATCPNLAGGRSGEVLAVTYIDEVESEEGVSRSIDLHIQPTPHVTQDTYPAPRTADLRIAWTSPTTLDGPLSASFNPGSTSGDGYGFTWDASSVFSFTTDLYEFYPTRFYLYSMNTSSQSMQYTDGQTTFAWPTSGFGTIPTGLTITSVPVPAGTSVPGREMMVGAFDLTYNPDGIEPDAGGTGMVTEGWGQEVLPVTGGTFTTTGPVSRGTLTVFDGEGRQMTQGTEWEYADNTGQHFTVMEGWPAYVTAAYRVTEPVLRPRLSSKRVSNPSVYADRIRLYDIKGV